MLLKEGYIRAKIQTDLYLKSYLGIEHVKQLGKELWVTKQMYMEKDLHIIKQKNGARKISNVNDINIILNNNNKNISIINKISNLGANSDNKIVKSKTVKAVCNTKKIKKIKLNTSVRYAFHRLSRSCWVVNLNNPTEESYSSGVSSTIGTYLYEYLYLFSHVLM
jgi:hypothetical protein